MPNTPDTAFIEALRWLGLTEPEATLFSVLADTPPPGGTLASLAGVASLPRATAHSALRALAKRGLIFSEGRYPARFRAAGRERIETLRVAQEEKMRRVLAAAEILRARLGRRD